VRCVWQGTLLTHPPHTHPVYPLDHTPGTCWCLTPVLSPLYINRWTPSSVFQGNRRGVRVWGLAVRSCASPSPLPPVHSMCSAGGCVCRRVCVAVLCCSVRGVGEVGRRRALAGVWCFCCCASRGLCFLPEPSALHPSSHFAFPSAVFVCVCVFAMAVHHWPLGLAPTSPSSCCRIYRGMGGGRWSCPYTRAVLQGDPRPCTLAHRPSPHTQCTRITRTLYHPAPTHLCNNRLEGHRDGCHDKLALL
jgi:hypothetical protein